MKILQKIKLLIKRINKHIKNNDGIYILVPSFLFIIVLGIGYVAVNHMNIQKSYPTVKPINIKIDSINNKIDSIKNYREKLKSINDTNKVKIITLEKHYETIKNNIIKQCPDSDYVFFSNYTAKYRKQYSSNNDSAVKN